MLDLANKVTKLQGRLVLSTFRQKSHSSLVLNTEHIMGWCTVVLHPHGHANMQGHVFHYLRQYVLQKVCVNMPSQATFKKMWSNDVIADIAALTINGPRMLKWYSSHPSRILICPIIYIMPIHISRICGVSFIRKKHMNQKSEICTHFSTNLITEIDAF